MFNKPSVKKVDILNKSDILFKISNGLGKLRMGYAKDRNDNVKVVFYLGDTPLIMCNSEYCPTCSTMIALAEGREEADEEVINILDDLNNICNLEDGFKKIKSILSLLDDGYYVLKEIEFYPTDGDGNFFWNLDYIPNDMGASSYFYARDYGTIVTEPKFLVPSQGTNLYNKDKVEYYREKIRNDESLYGLAIEMRGALGLLIDGHHKATASYLEGRPLKCLTIINVFQYNYYNTENEGISYIGNNIPYLNIKDAKDIKKFFDNRNNENTLISDRKISLEEKYYKPIEIELPKEEFPDYEYYALSTIAEDVSDERVRDLLEYKTKHSCDELKEVFYYLRVNDKERARKLAFSILNSEMFQNIWGECVTFLSRYQDEEVQDLFVNLLVEYDSYTFGYDEIRDIINEHFKEI